MHLSDLVRNAAAWLHPQQMCDSRNSRQQIVHGTGYDGPLGVIGGHWKWSR